MEHRFFGNRLPWIQQIMIWIFCLYIAWDIMDNGYGKLIQEPGITTFFAELEFSVFIMQAVGVVEFFGPLLLFIPQISFYMAFPIMVVMATASYYNSWNSETLIPLFLSLIIAYLSRPGFLKPKKIITMISV